jgi:hypothetical protein
MFKWFLISVLAIVLVSGCRKSIKAESFAPNFESGVEDRRRLLISRKPTPDTGKIQPTDEAGGEGLKMVVGDSSEIFRCSNEGFAQNRYFFAVESDYGVQIPFCGYFPFFERSVLFPNSTNSRLDFSSDFDPDNRKNQVSSGNSALIPYGILVDKDGDYLVCQYGTLYAFLKQGRYLLFCADIHFLGPDVAVLKLKDIQDLIDFVQKPEDVKIEGLHISTFDVRFLGFIKREVEKGEKERGEIRI